MQVSDPGAPAGAPVDCELEELAGGQALDEPLGLVAAHGIGQGRDEHLSGRAAHEGGAGLLLPAKVALDHPAALAVEGHAQPGKGADEAGGGGAHAGHSLRIGELQARGHGIGEVLAPGRYASPTATNSSPRPMTYSGISRAFCAAAARTYMFVADWLMASAKEQDAPCAPIVRSKASG